MNTKRSTSGSFLEYTSKTPYNFEAKNRDRRRPRISHTGVYLHSPLRQRSALCGPKQQRGHGSTPRVGVPEELLSKERSGPSVHLTWRTLCGAPLATTSTAPARRCRTMPYDGSSQRLRLVVLLLLGLALWNACAGNVPHPSPAQAEAIQQRWPGTTQADLNRGRQLYVARCGGCHNLYPPSAFAADLWPEIMEKMAARSRLTRQEHEEILRYLVAVTAPVSRRPPP